MSQLDVKQIAAEVKHAALDRNFLLCFVESNKGNILPLAISKEIVNTHFSANYRDGVFNPTTLIVDSFGTRSPAASKIPQDQKVIFRYNDTWCVGGVTDIKTFKEYVVDSVETLNMEKHIGFVSGVVCEELKSITAMNDLEHIEIQAQEAIHNSESRRKFTEYSKIPELADLMNHLTITVDNF